MKPAPISLEVVRTGRATLSTAGSPRQAFRFALEEIDSGADCVAVELGEQQGGILEALASLEGLALPGLVLVPGSSCRFPLAVLFDASNREALAALARLAPGPSAVFTRADAVALELPLGDTRLTNAQTL